VSNFKPNLISRSLTEVKALIRKIKMDFDQEKHGVTDKFQGELRHAIESFNQTFNEQKEKWAEELKYMHKQRARDRSDLELLIQKITGKVKKNKARAKDLAEILDAHASIVIITL